jgi:hypothetical protein
MFLYPEERGNGWSSAGFPDYYHIKTPLACLMWAVIRRVYGARDFFTCSEC